MKTFARGLVAALACSAAVPASAAYIVDITQQGNNVVATGSGSISLVGLTSPGSGFGGGYIDADHAELTVGTGQTNAYSTTVLVGPTSFGTQHYKAADSSTGAIVGVNARPSMISAVDFIIVPFQYQSGADLGTSTSTYLNTTFADLGLTAGSSYTWTWGIGADRDSFTINVLSGAVPEPATWALMILGFGLVGAAMRRRSAPAVRFA